MKKSIQSSKQDDQRSIAAASPTSAESTAAGVVQDNSPEALEVQQLQAHIDDSDEVAELVAQADQAHQHDLQQDQDLLAGVADEEAEEEQDNSTIARIRREHPLLSGAEIASRATLVDYMTAINDGSVGFDYPNAKNGLGTNGNLWRSSGVGISYTGDNPAAAFQQLMNPEISSYLDCERSGLIGMYVAELKSIGDRAFNTKYADKRISITFTLRKDSAPPNAPYNVVTINDEANLRAGDWVYFENHPDYLQHNRGGFWSGEHAYYMGDGNYQGFGTEVHSHDDMCAQLLRAFKAGYDGDMSDADILQQIRRIQYVRRPKFFDAL